MQNKTWTTNDIPDLSGKVAIVTGGNSGLGFESSLEFARKGATVIMASRNLSKGRAAVDRINTELGTENVDLMKLDLSDQESIKQFVNAFNQKYNRLDILLNNAGIMAVPQGKTAQGFELQLGTNHLGHFTLTGLLMEKLVGTSGSRVVSVASKAANNGKMNFDDLMNEKDYSPIGVYSQSKLANLLFTFELQRRFEEAGVDSLALAAHPGGSNTNLAEGMKMNKILKAILMPIFSLIMQGADQGARPQIFASSDPEAEGGKYYGPSGFGEMTGKYPKEAEIPAQALIKEDWKRFWEESEKLTGVKYEFLQKSAS